MIDDSHETAKMFVNAKKSKKKILIWYRYTAKELLVNVITALTFYKLRFGRDPNYRESSQVINKCA